MKSKASSRCRDTARLMVDAYAFGSLQEVRDIAALWLEEYNTVRPHQALGDLPPYAYAVAAKF